MSGLALQQYRIRAAGVFAQVLSEDRRRELREVMAELAVTPLRRSNRFISLAVLAAELCQRDLGHPPPADAGVYLATAHGSFTDTVTLLRHQLVNQQPVTPFRFVNVLSNVAGFHVAARLGTQGENLAISRLRGAFDAAIETASLDLALGKNDCALVGGVDEGDDCLTLHRQRTGTPRDRQPGEGAGWLVLAPARVGEPADLEHLGDFLDWQAVRATIDTRSPDWIAAGPESWHRPASLPKAFPDIPCWDYHDHMGWSPTNTAAAFARHHLNGRGRLLHLDRSAPGGAWRLWLLHARHHEPA
ncbi:beta-ketoacyl synthase N-terminal-like domain-containing protein [Natronospira bacteriovora]|uniref:Beta-ketoacyl synthase N-terminal-like domain-containing protein n=1 Tax=Natronospira bacteriovora TaxID=3069753 RepID=A0ABU0W7K8_9GAMM|nr:beta-ketoacyl synthase N-terminal-like domain-containing protein [Natronospira sp. AB-CW4]MDQ2070002.1 beta-ketoacyl synthase N-terminal-like domain-containing protein [Natronospira sp. AB-CW4]